MEATNSKNENEPSTSSASLHKRRGEMSQECSNTKKKKIEEHSQGVNQMKQNIIDLHINIRSEDNKKVEENIQNFAYDQHACNDAGQSAIATSLEVWNLEIYEILITNGFRLGPHEDIQELVKGNFKRKQIFEIHRKCAIESEKEHLTVLRSKCRLHFNSPEDKKEEYFQAIMTALEKLDETADGVSTLLKIVALCPELKIIFDFNRTSTDEIDPRDNKYTEGSCYFSIFCVTVGAKNLLDSEKCSEVLGTMAHEFCHLAMYLMFKNGCKPYEESNAERKKKFEKIVNDYKKRFDRKEIGEKIVELVYDENCYGENVWHAELIVRVPHMLANYNGNDGKLEQLRDNFSELFEFYEALMPKTKQNMSEMKVEFAVKEINEICGVSSELQASVFNLCDDAIEKFEIDFESKNLQVYKSNCVELTMQTIREKAMKVKTNKFLIFAKVENFKIEKIAKQIFAALESSEKVSVIVNCDKIDEKKSKIIDEISEQTAKNQKIVFVSNEKLKIAAIECQEVNHLWSELTEELQKKLLDIKVNFQGKKLELNEIWSKNLEVVESVPLDELSKGKEIKIGEEIKFEEIHVERKFLAPDTKWYEKPSEVNEIIKEIENTKVFVLSDAPGNGKTTEFKFLTFKLKENFKNRWILLIDLKVHTKNFEKDSENSTNFDSVEEITDFLAEKILKLKNFQKEIFSELFKNDRVVALMDGVDEISPSYKNFVMNLADGIRKLTRNQLWMATRPHLAKELEEKLETKAWHLTKFSKRDQKSFFEKIFKKRKLKYEKFRRPIKTFLDEIEKKRTIWYSTEDVTNPLLLHMIAELFIDNPNFQLQNSSLYKIYDEFVKKMLRKLLRRGKEAENDSVNFMGDMSIQEFHRKIAVEQKFNMIKFGWELNHLFKNLPEPSDDQLTRVGLIYNYGYGYYFFIHETFKEFFIAQTIIEKIYNLKFHSKDELKEVLEILYFVITDKYDRYSVIKKFLEDALQNFQIDENCEKSKILIDSLINNKFDFNEAAREGCKNLLISLSKLIVDSQKVMEIWMECDVGGSNVLATAFRWQTFEKFQILWSFADEFFTESQIKKLITDMLKDPYCFETAICNEDERVFEFFLSLTNKLNSSKKEKLINCKSLNMKHICWNENLKLVLSRIKKFLTDHYEDFLKDLKENWFNDACGRQNCESIKFLCEEIIENFGSEELIVTLQRTDENGWNVLMFAVGNHKNPEVFETLMNFIENENKVRKMLKEKNELGYIVLMIALEWPREKSKNIRKVLEVYEKYFDIEELKGIFIIENKDNKNVLDVAAGKTFERFEIIWDFMRKLFDVEIMRKMLMKSLKYVKSNYLIKCMPIILQTLNVDEYHVIFPKWFEAAKKFDSDKLKELSASVDSQNEFAVLFYKKLFEFRDEKNQTIIDCAKQNKRDSKEVLELFNEKQNMNMMMEITGTLVLPLLC